MLSTLGPEFTVDDLVSKLGLSPSTAKRYIRSMLQMGLVHEEGGKLKVTEEGKLLLELTKARDVKTNVNQSYVFTGLDGSPLVLRVDSLEKLYAIVKYDLVPEEVLKHHIEKRYLPSWISSQLGAELLAEKLRKVKNKDEVLKLLEDAVH